LTGGTLVVAGDGAAPIADEVVSVVRRQCWPVLAEASAGLASVALPHGALLVGDVPAPDHVVVVGTPTLHRPVRELLAAGAEVVVVTRSPRWPEAGGAARVVGPEWLAGVDGPPDPAWLERWQRAAAARAAQLVPIVDASWPSGLSVARTTMAALPTGAAIQLGSSNPVRDVDLAADPRPDVRVVANRGLAGIDGTVSSAVGLALIHEGPTYALVGDLTFLHDLTGVIIGPQEPAPDLMIVVVNDDGGGIFSTLEQGAPEYAERFERLFGTPTGADLAGLCAGVGVSHQLASTREELAEAVVAAPRGLSVVEVRCRRDSLRGLHGAIRAPLRGQ
jgi:2-succinyl-5-enolpyruvyl-6-hydroxy-3-cyclohexene-1-carboxylate synthase